MDYYMEDEAPDQEYPELDDYEPQDYLALQDIRCKTLTSGNLCYSGGALEVVVDRKYGDLTLSLGSQESFHLEPEEVEILKLILSEL